MAAAKRAPKPLPIGTAESILAASLKEDTVEVPEWGCSVRLREFSHREECEILKRVTAEDGTVDEGRFQLMYAVGSIVEPAFTPEQIEELGEKSSLAISRVFWAAQALNSARKEDADRSVASFPAG